MTLTRHERLMKHWRRVEQQENMSTSPLYQLKTFSLESGKRKIKHNKLVLACFGEVAVS